MELRHLRYFQAVAEELSFSKAAKRLHVAQPAISRAVKDLEGRIGVELLVRTKRSVMLAPAGAVLLQETGVLLLRLDEATRRVRRTAAGEEGELRLGYIGPPTQPFLGRLLHEYRRRHPRVSIHLEERTPERTWEMVAKNRLSVALTRPVPTHEALGLKTILLREERLGLAVPHNHPLAHRKSLPWRSLANEPLIVLARREGMGLNAVIEVGSMEAAKELVKLGLGVGVLVPWIARKELDAHSLVSLPLGRRKLRRNWGILRHTGIE